MNFRKSTVGRFLPLKTRFSGKRATTRQAATLIALAVLIGMAIVAYSWYAGNVAQREMMTAGNESGQITVPPPVEVEGLAQAVNVPGNTSVVPMDPGNIDDPDRRRSTCGYLAAELERLDYEFKQPLPPPVIDHIATQITRLHTQANRYDCMLGKGSADAGTDTDLDTSNSKQNSVHSPDRRRATPTPEVQSKLNR